MEAWLILLPALVMSALLVFSHTYLGLHVLARGVIFVDLALAQVAALGVSIAFFMGEEGEGWAPRAYAFGASLLAAAGFATLRRIADQTTREVIIGCVYVVATAAAVVLLSRSAQGMEELKAMFNGQLLWVQWQEIVQVALIYGGLAVVHWLYRRRFIALSSGMDKDIPATGAAWAWWWEFVFFASFAVVITWAVQVAGVLLVFAYLILPAFSASLLGGGWGRRLGTGWLFGLMGSVLGLYLSYLGDLPTGATMVVVLGALPVAAVLLRGLGQRS